MVGSSTNKRTQRQGMQSNETKVEGSTHLRWPGKFKKIIYLSGVWFFESKYTVIALFARSNIMSGTK